MSAAYVPPFTAVQAPMWRGTVALDAALVDLLQGQRSRGFTVDNPSLWPPAAEGKGEMQSTRHTPSSPPICNATSESPAPRRTHHRATATRQEERATKPTRVMVSSDWQPGSLLKASSSLHHD